MVSTRTKYRNKKIEILKESINMIVELLLMEKRELETANMCHYKQVFNGLKTIHTEAKAYNKVITERTEILLNG